MAAVKYHLSSNGPRRCKAEVRECPYGAAGEEHYATQAEAMEAYEVRMTKQFGVMESIRGSERVRQARYKAQDGACQTIAAAKASKPAQATANTMREIHRSAIRKTMKLESKMYHFEKRAQARLEERQAALMARIDSVRLTVDRMGERLQETAQALDTKQREALNSLKAAARGLRGGGVRKGEKPTRAERRELWAQRTRLKSAHKLQPGDRVEGDLRVHMAIDQGDQVRVFLMDQDGQFAGVKNYRDVDTVAFTPADKREIRSQEPRRPRRKLSETAFAQRVKAVSEAQANVFRVMRGLDTEKVERVHVPSRSRKHPINERLRRAKATASVAQDNALLDLYATRNEGRRKRRRAVTHVLVDA